MGPGSLQPFSQPQLQYRDPCSNLGLTLGDPFGRLGPESPLTHPQQASLWLGALDPLRRWMEGWASRDRPGENMDMGTGSATGWLGGFISAAQPF